VCLSEAWFNPDAWSLALLSQQATGCAHGPVERGGEAAVQGHISETEQPNKNMNNFTLIKLLSKK
jgi:hypothetical protein